MKIKNSFFIAFFIGLLIISFISAETGLEIDKNSFDIEKTHGIEKNINFTLSNPTTYDFYNISFEENEVIQLEEISELKSGHNKTVTAIIKGNEKGNYNISLQGYFYAEDIGYGNKTHEVSINEQNEVEPGDFSIYVDEKIRFINNREDRVFVKIGDSEGKQINSGENFTYTVKNEENFDYFFYEEVSFNRITEDYSVSVLPTEGFITNPNFNPTLNLNLNIIYPETNVTAQLSETNYEIEAFSETDGMITIKNTGEKIAKNVNLDSRWISFSENDFDINPGSTKGLIYKISPKLTNTNQTNQTYEEILKISGNFETLEKKINITIPYAEIKDGQYKQGKSLLEWIREYCEKNPEDDICGGQKEVIYKEPDDNITIETGNDQFREFVNYVISQLREVKVDTSQQKELITNLNSSSTNESEKLNRILSELEQGNTRAEEATNALYTILAIFFISLISGILIFIIFTLKKQNKLGIYLDRTWKKLNRA